MNRLWRLPPLAALLVAAAAAPLPAQDGKPPTPDPATEELNALQKAYRGKLRDAAVKEAPDAARAALAKDFLPQFEAFAAKHAGSSAGLRATATVLGMHATARDDAAWKKAFDAALASYADMDGFAMIVRSIEGDDAEANWTRIAEVSKNAEVKAAARMAIAEKAWDYGTATGDALAKAKAGFEAVARDHAGTRPGRQAKANLFEIEHLQVGMPAPDVPFTDLSGKVHKLSEYRGRVVLLNFWASW